MQFIFSEGETKNDQRHKKRVGQCLSHLENLSTSNKAYNDFKTDLQHAIEFTGKPENTLLQGSTLLKYFVAKLYNSYNCLCDIK